ncbi:MAG: helix-turn-helix transcriptional regulator [Gordonibacter sp.]
MSRKVLVVTIQVKLDRVMRTSSLNGNDLAARVGITSVNLSRIRTGKTRAIRFSTLDALCESLGCQPGDLLMHVSNDVSASEDDEQ